MNHEDEVILFVLDLADGNLLSRSGNADKIADIQQAVGVYQDMENDIYERLRESEHVSVKWNGDGLE